MYVCVCVGACMDVNSVYMFMCMDAYLDVDSMFMCVEHIWMLTLYVCLRLLGAYMIVNCMYI